MTEKIFSSDQVLTTDVIDNLRSVLKEKPRDLLLFELAIQTGCKIKDLLALRVRDLEGIKVGDEIVALSKNGDQCRVMTETLMGSFNLYKDRQKPRPHDFIFIAQKTLKPLSRSRATAVIKDWFRSANVEGDHGAVSLRKTWEYSAKNTNTSESIAADLNTMDVFSPMKIQTAQQMVYNELSKAIISGKIPPGTRFTAAEIAKSYNVGLAPVRVALYWLEAKRFIVTQKKKACIVNKLSIEELKEIIGLRLILEIQAFKSSIDLCTDETLSLAESIIDMEEKATSFEEISSLNAKFHQTIYRDAKIPILRQIMSDLADRISPYIIMFFANRDLNDNTITSLSQEYHRKIIESMRRKDLDKAMKYLQFDLEKGTAILEKILEKRAYSY